MTTPLLLIPGLLCDALLWAHQVRHLADIATPMVADVTQGDSIAALAQAALAGAPEKFALAGLSMGGYVALEIMRTAPERVLKLALVDTSARPDPPEAIARRQGLINLAKTGKFKGVTPRLLPLLVHPNHVKNPAIADVVMQMAEATGRAAFIRQQQAIIGRGDSRPHLQDITAPTLVIVGREDRITPLAVAEEMAAGIPNARLAVIEDCGHLAPLEQPQATTALLRLWLMAER